MNKRFKIVPKESVKPCIACNGTGYYDHDNSPKCGACKGTGRENPGFFNNLTPEQQKMALEYRGEEF